MIFIYFLAFVLLAGAVLLSSFGIMTIVPYILAEFVSGMEGLPALVQADFSHYMSVGAIIIGVIACISTFTRRMVLNSACSCFIFWLPEKILLKIASTSFWGKLLFVAIFIAFGFILSFIIRNFIPDLEEICVALKEYSYGEKTSVLVGLIPAIAATAFMYDGVLLFVLMDSFANMTPEEGIPFVVSIYIITTVEAIVVTIGYAIFNSNLLKAKRN